ncbi:MAG: pentapeptide repeat-containing protein [Rubripirellula sp.]
MAKRKQATTKSKLPQRFAGQKIVVAGKDKKYGTCPTKLKGLCEHEGATCQTSVVEITELLVLMPLGAAKEKKKAEQLNKKGASIEIINCDEMLDRLRPDETVVLALLKAGKVGHERLQDLLSICGCIRSPLTDCESISLKGMDLKEFTLDRIQLQGADLRETNLYGCHAGELVDVDLRKSAGSHFYAASLIRCDCREASWPSFFLDNGYVSGKAIVDSDFTKVDFSAAYLSYGDAMGSKFCKANFSEVEADTSTYESCDFTGADFSSAKMTKHKFSKGCSFVRAKAVNANFADTDFGDTDLSKVDFTGARLTCCNFSKAKLAGANFKDAVLLDAKLGSADVSKVKNLTLPELTKVKTGAACRKLEAVLGSCPEFAVSCQLLMGYGPITIRAHRHMYLGSGALASYELHYKVVEKEKVYDDGWIRQRKEFRDDIPEASLTAALKKLGEMWGHGELQIDTIKCTAKKCSLRGKALSEAALAAVTEVFQGKPPTEKEVQAKKQSAKAKIAQAKEDLLQELCGGKAGIAKFNARDPYQLRRMKLMKFRKADFTGMKMAGLKAHEGDFAGCNFSDASLTKVSLRDAVIKGTVFVGANLKQADLHGATLQDCDFSGANLTQAVLDWSRLTNAKLVKANLTKASLKDANLEGVDLTGAKLAGVILQDATFSEKTLFPKGFKIPADMEFRGMGHDPRLKTKRRVGGSKVKTFDEFMEKASSSVDHSRLDKAMKMLKKDSFELFSDVSDLSVVGVVRSQSDASLVYSCRLTEEGNFSCCTQNLNACGGLRGALCKHLLVLLIGLAKSEAIDLSTAAAWMGTSKLRKPELDKDAMAEVLLKYKGVESGEVDWRPTETVPEDYFAL